MTLEFAATESIPRPGKTEDKKNQKTIQKTGASVRRATRHDVWAGIRCPTRQNVRSPSGKNPRIFGGISDRMDGCCPPCCHRSLFLAIFDWQTVWKTRRARLDFACWTAAVRRILEDLQRLCFAHDALPTTAACWVLPGCWRGLSGALFSPMQRGPGISAGADFD